MVRMFMAKGIRRSQGPGRHKGGENRREPYRHVKPGGQRAAGARLTSWQLSDA
jgi:hypothetical protein